jgi:enoyl-CoA hydratase/carnithine racemase
MQEWQGKGLSWALRAGVLELQLHRAPANEIGSEMLAELEMFASALNGLNDSAQAMLIYSSMKPGFSAGADLREQYEGIQQTDVSGRISGVRDFIERIHRVMNAIDTWPHPTVAAVHGVCFGGGLELALTADIIVADKMARFCFPELRLGLIPGFGGIPRLKRDLGNAIVRDLLLTGRSLNATRAHSAGLVAQLSGEGESLRVARSVVQQLGKFDRLTTSAAKEFIKPIPYGELVREIDLFCELIQRPAVVEGLRRFVESTDAQPYLP